MHTDTYPSPAENQTPLQFKEAIKRITRAAEERIRNNLEFGNKTITIHKLSNHQDMKALEKSLQLPANTPESARKFFNSYFLERVLYRFLSGRVVFFFPVRLA
jgi:hypothetical protein